jgi:segregation and condensation protein A
MSLTIQLPKFEGPMGLLLYLIRKEEMDIMDIKIHEITKQYLEFIKLMKELDLEVAGEFISMASTLIHIKSRMLLPQYNENGEVIETEDPRKELVQRLLEYQKFQEASKNLYERPLLGRDVFARGVREKLDGKEEEIVLEENALFSLIAAYRTALRTMKKKVHQVAAKAQSIASRILEMKDRLTLGSRVAMSDLLDSASERRRQVLITFLSLLELGKMGLVSLYQSDTYQEIYVEAKRAIDTNILDRVEEYDSMRADEIAATMMQKAQKIDENEEFVLPDELDPDEQLALQEPGEEFEMASDEEILAAENEILS